MRETDFNVDVAPTDPQQRVEALHVLPSLVAHIIAQSLNPVVHVLEDGAGELLQTQVDAINVFGGGQLLHLVRYVEELLDPLVVHDVARVMLPPLGCDLLLWKSKRVLDTSCNFILLYNTTRHISLDVLDRPLNP